MANDEVVLAPLIEKAALQRAGGLKSSNGIKAPTMEAWRKGRTTSYGQIELTPTDSGVEEEVVNGVVVKHYN